MVAAPTAVAVPNFSEGRRSEVVDAIAAAATGAGALLLDHHSDADHNRSVLTLAGGLDILGEAAFAGAAAAVELVDLRRHVGVHPRMGAVDVIPFVPHGGTEMAACIDAARELGGRIARELRVPVYLYGDAARAGRPRSLAAIRDGGFEALRALGKELPKPDFGPRRLHPGAGAVAVGARRPLIAFNLLISGTDVGAAQRIARGLRASAGGLPAVQALGLWLPARHAAQVSMNLLDYEVTGLAEVLKRARQLATDEGVKVTSGELVGLLPAAARAGLSRETLPGLPGTQDTIEARLGRAAGA